MIKIFFRCFLFILVFIANKSFSQSNMLADSTLQSLSKIQPDSVRTTKTLEYAYKLIGKKKVLGKEISDQLISTAILKKDTHTLGKIYATIGFAYLSLGDYDKAYPIYLKALKAYDKLNEPERLVRVYQEMCWIHVQLKNHAEAENAIQIALKICKEHNLHGKMGEVYNLEGVVYDNQEKYDKAIECYKLAIPLAEKYGTIYSRTSNYINLGISQRRSKRYDDAFASLLKAKELMEKANLAYYRQAVYQNLAELTFNMKDYANAEKYILQALALSKENNEMVIRQGLFTNLQTLYESKRDYKKALQYADSARLLREQVFAKEKVSEVRNLQAKYETQIKDAKIAKQNVMYVQQRQLLNIQDSKLQLTVKQKKIQQLSFIQRQIVLENERKLQASLLQKTNLQAKLNKQISDAQIFKQSEKIKSNNRFQLFLILVVAGALVISSIIYFNQRKTKQLNVVISSQKQDLETTNAIKDRMFGIIGHDMRSPINSLIAFNHLLEDSSLSAEKVKVYAKEIKKTLNQTAVLMENLLSWSSSQMQGYKPDMQNHLLSAIANQAISVAAEQAAQKGINVKNNIAASAIVFTDANMAELVMRNIITNAIKFTPVNGVVELSAEKRLNQTVLIIKDTGTGMEADKEMQFNTAEIDYKPETQPGTNKEKGTGLGLMLCKTFIRLLNGKIEAESEPGKGSTFYVTLPSAA